MEKNKYCRDRLSKDIYCPPAPKFRKGNERIKSRMQFQVPKTI
jgi:hypothetical protein